MRPTHFTSLLLALSSLFAAACMGQVGGGRTSGSGSDDGSGSDTTDDGTCDHIVDYKHDLAVHDMNALSATLPTDCYNVLGKLTIDGASVTSFSKLGKIRSVTDLEITNSGLESIDTVVPLAIYDGGLLLKNNAKLTDVSNLEFHHVSHVLIDGNKALTDLDGLSLDTIDGDTGDARRDGTLTITNNLALVDISLPTVTRVDGPIKISGNAAATSVSLGALVSVGTYPWKGTVEISNNVNLTTVSSLSIVALTGDLLFTGNPKLATLGGLQQLAHVGGAFTIDGTALADLTAIGTPFEYVDGTITVNNNANLTKLNQLSHMRDAGNGNSLRPGNIGGALVITNNHNLPYCEAHAVDYCTDTAGAVTISGNNNNQTNCQSWCRNLL